MNDLERALRDIEKDGRWMALGFFDDADLAALEGEVGRTLPESLKELLRATVGGWWTGRHIVQFLDADGLRDVNRAEPVVTQHAGVWIFAEDAGPHHYVVDAEDALGNGAGAVSTIPIGSSTPDDAERVAPDVRSFLRWMVDRG